MSIDKGTIARTVFLGIAVINMILGMKGQIPIDVDYEEVYKDVSLIYTAVISVWTWWRNNSFTKHAAKADKVLAKIKGDEEIAAKVAALLKEAENREK